MEMWVDGCSEYVYIDRVFKRLRFDSSLMCVLFVTLSFGLFIPVKKYQET